MMQLLPKISIITATYNSAKTIGDTIKMVLKQTYDNYEYIIVDGDSKDETLEIVRSFEDKFKEKVVDYKWISEPDTGVYSAWNKALRIVKGEWIVFIGSDDYFYSELVLERVIPILDTAQSDSINFVYGKIKHINNIGEVIEESGKPWEIQKDTFTQAMNIGHSGSFHSSNLFANYGIFNDTFKIAGDYEFLLREFKDPSKNALFIQEYTLFMREGGLSANLQDRLTLVKESKLARKYNGITSFSWKLVFWEFRVRTIVLISKLLGDGFAAKAADLYRELLGKKKRWTN